MASSDKYLYRKTGITLKKLIDKKMAKKVGIKVVQNT